MNLIQHIQDLSNLIKNSGGVYEETINFLLESINDGDYYSYNSFNDLSYRYARIVKPEIKGCYKNSLLAALTIDELEYCEGYYLTDGLPMPLEHAFNILDGGIVIDVTAAEHNIRVVEYLGVTVPKRVLREYIKTEQFLTPLQYYIKELNK